MIKPLRNKKATLVALKQFKEKFNEENSKNSIEKHEVILSKFNDRLVNLEQFASTLPSEPVSNTGEIDQLRRELNESKQTNSIYFKSPSNSLYCFWNFYWYVSDCLAFHVIEVRYVNFSR